MDTLEKVLKLKNEILDSASNQDKGKHIGSSILIARRKGKNPEFVLTNGKKIVLKRIADTSSTSIK